MQPKEQELLAQIQAAENLQREAKSRLSKVRRDLLDAETNAVNANIQLATLREQLRQYYATTPKYAPDARDLEIEKFRSDNPEIMEWVKQRDEKKYD